MSRPTSALWLALVGVLLLGVLAGALQAAGPVVKQAPATRNVNKDHGGFFPPVADLAQALEQAHRSGRKGVAVLYEMEGCSQCALLRATTLKDQTLRKWYAANFVTASLLADHPLPLVDFDRQKTDQSTFARRERIDALPTLVFYDLDSLPVARQQGSVGEVADWLRLGRYVVEKGYEEAPFAHWRPGS